MTTLEVSLMSFDHTVYSQIFNQCLYTTEYVAEFDNPERRATEDAIRHTHSISQLEKYISENDVDELRILNASGLAYGSQDLAIKAYLDEECQSLSTKWTVIESPNSEYLCDEKLQHMMERLNIERYISDLKNVDWNELGAYDAVLFTEIAEHLDYSTLLSTLISIRGVLVDGGLLIFTTPNQLRLKNRLKFLIGLDDIYWGDSVENMQKELYGHINYYGLDRLQRLLKDVGFEIKTSSSFNALKSDITTFGGMIQKVLQVLSVSTKLKEYLLITAENKG